MSPKAVFIFGLCVVVIMLGLLIWGIADYRKSELTSPYCLTIRKIDTGIEIVKYNKKKEKLQTRIIEDNDSYTLILSNGVLSYEEFISGKPVVQEK